MNLIRGILSIGIVIGCLFNWVDIEAERMMFSFSGLSWVPSTILLYASVVTAGYAFYNSYTSSNQNSWIYVTCGLYGLGVSIYIYLSVIGNVSIIYAMVPTKVTDSMGFSFGLGIYLTGLLSLLLMLSGLDNKQKKNHLAQVSFEQSNDSMRQQNNSQLEPLEKSDKPHLRDWLKQNPGKSINDYYSRK